MRGLLIAALLSLSACASAPVPVSLTAMMRLQLKERAGLYPDDWIVKGATHEAQYVQLQAWAEQQGIRVMTGPLWKFGLMGRVWFSDDVWTILINRDLGPDAKFYTLLHELGHLYGPATLNDGDGEVFAEMTAGLVCQRVGLPVWPEMAAYLVRRVPSLDQQAQTVQRHGVAIDRLVDRLTVAVTSGR